MKKLPSLLLIICVLAHFRAHSAFAASDSLYFLHQDNLGSTKVVTNREGNVVAKYDYWPYGSTFSEAAGQLGSQTVERLYTSQIKDPSTELYFYNARYYNPEIGVFLSADTVQGPNRYAYVSGNPINGIDPSGNIGPIEPPTPGRRGVSGGGVGGGGTYGQGEFNLWSAMFGRPEDAWVNRVCGGDPACTAQHAFASVTYGAIGWDPLRVLSWEEKVELDVGMAVVGLVNPFSGPKAYVSARGERLLIDEAKDPRLRKALQRAYNWVLQKRTRSSISRVDLVAEYVSALPYSKEVEKGIYASGKGKAWLGQFVEEGGATVCREKAVFAHLLLDKLGIKSRVVRGSMAQGGRHAWVEGMDTLRGYVVMDPTFNEVIRMSQYYQKYGISNVRAFEFIK